MQILTHNDRADLKPGQYVLISLERLPKIADGIPADQRARILQRNGFTCQACGVGAGEPDPLDPHRKARLNVDHIIPLSEGGTNEDSNLRVTCTACNLGRSNLFTPPSSRSVNILANIRRAPRSAQREVYEFLRRKFEPSQRQK
ncbi:MAG: HNH endonuclease signature motif containing protein [Methanobacteriota archaeon]